MASPREAPRGQQNRQLTNYDVVWLMKLVDAHLNDARLVPGKGGSREEMDRYQHNLLLKLRALDLDAIYGRENG